MRKRYDIIKISGFNKQSFIVLVLVLLGFEGSFAAKVALINNQTCMARLLHIDLDSDEGPYFLYINSVDSCNGIYNTADDLFHRMCSQWNTWFNFKSIQCH